MKIKMMIAAASLAACTSVPPPEKAEVNGVEIDYVVQGSGPPLFLLHGGMESRDSFANQIPEFARHFTVVALDSRKQGRSGGFDKPVSYDLMAEDVFELARYLGFDQISIVGLSDGGITAITSAVKRPDFIDNMVILGATFHYTSYSESTREFIANYEWDGNTDPTGFPGNFIKHYLTGHEDLSGFGELLQEMAQMWTTSPTFETSDLARITARTLVINGDHEDVPLDHTLQLYHGLSDAELFVVPGATHYALEEKPELLNSVIIRFLTTSDATLN